MSDFEGWTDTRYQNVIEDLRESLRREVRYRERVEHDYSLVRDAAESVRYQQGMTLPIARRMLGTALRGCTFALDRAHALQPVADHVLLSRIKQVGPPGESP